VGEREGVIPTKDEQNRVSGGKVLPKCKMANSSGRQGKEPIACCGLSKNKTAPSISKNEAGKFKNKKRKSFATRAGKKHKQGIDNGVLKKSRTGEEGGDQKF